MDDEALAFLERWAEDHVRPKPSVGRAEHIEKLVARCYRDAEEAGISNASLDEAAAEGTEGEDLVAFIETALEQREIADLGQVDEEDE